MFSQYKYLFIGAAILLPTLASFYYKSQLELVEKDLVRAEGIVVHLESSLAASNALADKHYELLQAQRETNRVLAKESRDKSVEINKYKDREQVVYKKPGLVERLEQKAMDEFMEDLTNGQ
tara:strand:- start:5006 stop:5368 length:363 start_codon:yes stop_codon:yes gene_type:complete